MTALQIALMRLPRGVGLPLPTYATTGAVRMDFVSAEALTLAPRDCAAIATGFAAIPEGYEIKVRPRSDLALRHRITCLISPGTIDSDYRGELKVILANFADTSFDIARGDRIAQLVPAPVQRVAFVEVADVEVPLRGGGALGSTGR